MLGFSTASWRSSVQSRDRAFFSSGTPEDLRGERGEEARLSLASVEQSECVEVSLCSYDFFSYDVHARRDRTPEACFERRGEVGVGGWIGRVLFPLQLLSSSLSLSETAETAENFPD